MQSLKQYLKPFRVSYTIDIICVWGRIGGNLGNYKIITCENEEEVDKTIEQVKKTRLSRGYILCSI